LAANAPAFGALSHWIKLSVKGIRRDAARRDRDKKRRPATHPGIARPDGNRFANSHAGNFGSAPIIHPLFPKSTRVTRVDFSASASKSG
jgi:hypothetical protein